GWGRWVGCVGSGWSVSCGGSVRSVGWVDRPPDRPDPPDLPDPPDRPDLPDLHSIFKSSTSNTSMPYGGRLPSYASFSGIQKRAFSPSNISCSPSVHPGITPFTANDAGWPRTTELSNILPSVVHPE